MTDTSMLDTISTHVTISHQSVWTFMLERTHHGFFDRFDEAEVHSEIFRACIDYLGQLSECADLSAFPLARYAVSHWPYHRKMCSLRSCTEYVVSGLDVLANEKMFETWLRLYDINRHSLHRQPLDLHLKSPKVTALYCAASLGLSQEYTNLLA